MLCCVYHPVMKFRVVEDTERDQLLKTGVWFNTPTEAKNLRKQYNEEEKRRKDGERICESGKPRKQKAKRKAQVDG